MHSLMIPHNGRMLMAMALVMSRQASNKIVVQIHRLPATVTDMVAPIRLVTAGLIKVIDSHTTLHSGWMQIGMASVITQMATRRTVVPTN